MAWIEMDDTDIVVRLSTMEKVLALRGDWRVPRELLVSAEAVDNLWEHRRGLRIGTGLPGLLLVGSTHYRGGRDFVAIYGQRSPGLVLTFADGAPYRRALLSQIDSLMAERLKLPSAAARV